ncbi:GDSL-type esterase/lipase family protein [Terrimonas sp. NA20]|uniref:GDSL-type esterase/lipase family protein n=1 Tax=Terrimonas ginsenosidimutans TaxID=2908004 RepID=A0ABS9KL85_9BACT|nr:GDSL-type esterase/lipase family protein [Terrimonas ginsenosidimutans]MCG2613092.1 GDSL-type esterase/lipase family protein [Terrimonas ginsenosidimutans]
MILRLLYTLALACIIHLNGFCQRIPTDDHALAQRYPFVSAVFNRIFNNTSLDSFYQKLYTLKKDSNSVVSIVHIGDSHIQADFLSGTVRKNLQDFFGNAGRGLVFPYQIALSNAPQDIISSSSIRWQFNRVAHPEIQISSGISGYAITTTSEAANLRVSLRTSFTEGLQVFNKMKFFLDTSANTSWIFQADNLDIPHTLSRESNDSSVYREVELKQPITGFTLTSLPTSEPKAFYGVSLENSAPGILYHTIGVNGARYDQYNIAPLFWKQLPALKADLYIISLGTNEAQRASFFEAMFLKDLETFLEKLRQTSPGASILITTAPDSYRQRRASNAVLQSLNKSLSAYCNKKFIPLWDLYRITNGYGSAYSWSRRGLMSRDKVHFTADGYRLQGSLLFNALAKGFNDYVSSLGAP